MDEEHNEIYEKCDETVSELVVKAKAASINLKADAIYPESFMIAILIGGANMVNSILVDMNVNLERCLKKVKTDILNKKTSSIAHVDYDNIEISKQIPDVFKIANKISIDMKHGHIGIQHLFLALLQNAKNINNVFRSEGFEIEGFLASLKRNRPPKLSKRLKTRKGERHAAKLLEEFCTDMTEQAATNKIDPIIAREKEIEEAITIFCRRGKNNPLLIGEPGVGKTAIVEGLSQRIVSGTVPKQLLDYRVYSLNMSSIVAGTKYRGEFEERMQSLIREVQDIENCILFIDEIHTLIGAGSAAGGALDASNILKPFLARNELKCIGATTLADYKKYFQKDGALTRRFHQIIVEEPNEEQTLQILHGIKNKYEDYHGVIITEDAVEACIALTKRYLPNKNFPDKAIDCMDSACAQRVAWVESSDDHGTPTIIAEDIAKVISVQSQIPIEIISLWDDNERIKSIEGELSRRVIGQKEAVAIVCTSLKNAYSGIRDPNKPIGSFVFGGQSGTGKTYMAKELAMAVFGKESSFIRLDMSEFSESHSVSKLIGSPPGYVGFHETDVFIDKVRRKPYCIVLLDEVEKSNPDVMKLFLQVMSDGVMTDAIGTSVSFKNVVLIMTGNFGMNDPAKQSLGFDDKDKEDSREKERKRLIEYFKNSYGDEVVNRIDAFIPFMELNEDSLTEIAKIQLEEVSSRLAHSNCNLVFSDKVCGLLIHLSKEEHGRNATLLKRLISKKIEPCVSDILLSMDHKELYTITVDVKANEFVCKKKKKPATKKKDSSSKKTATKTARKNKKSKVPKNKPSR